MSFAEIIKDGSDLSVPKLVGMVYQSLFDRLVTRQHHHLLWSKVDREHWTVFLGKLKKMQVKLRKQTDVDVMHTIVQLQLKEKPTRRSS